MPGRMARDRSGYRDNGGRVGSSAPPGGLSHSWRGVRLLGLEGRDADAGRFWFCTYLLSDPG